MPKIDFLHICERTESSPSGHPCIISIIDVFAVPPGARLPVTLPRLVVALQWRGTPGETIDYSVTVRDFVGTAVAASQQQAVLGNNGPAGRGKAFEEVAVANVAFQATGVYTVVVAVDEQVLAWTPLEVRRS